MEQLLEKYLPGYVSQKEVNEVRGPVKLQRQHFEWLIDLLAGTLQAINASNINKKKAIEIFAAGLNGTNSAFNRERFIRTAYKKILADEAPVETPMEVENPESLERRLGEEETLDEKKKKKIPLKECPACGAKMPAFFNKCPKCDKPVGDAKKEDGEVKVEKEEKKEAKK
jgi:hypothetical protein